MSLGNCSFCGSSCLVITQASLRCNQCGKQSKIPKRLPDVPKSYISYGFQHVEKLTEEEKLHLRRTFETKEGEEVEIDTASPKVSIIMPTYCRQHTINDTIASIFAQTYTNWELIIIDNEPHHTYSFRNQRIRYYKHSEELGAAYARNQGIQYITGDLVCFFDDDDIMDPEYLKVMSSPFQNSSVQLTTCLIKLVEGAVPSHDSFCTPITMIRKELATATWQRTGAHDRDYFTPLAKNAPGGSHVLINKVLVRSFTSPKGGLRVGSL